MHRGGHQVQVVLRVPARRHEGPGLRQGERRQWILSGNLWNKKLTKVVRKHNPILVGTHNFKVQQDNQRKGKGKGGLLYASVLAPNKCCDKGNVTNGWQEKQTNIAINVRLETFLYSAHNNNLKVNPKLLTHNVCQSVKKN